MSVRYVEVKPKDDPQAKSYTLRVSGDHTEDSAKTHVERFCPGVDFVRHVSADKYAASVKPTTGQLIQQPTSPDGTNQPADSAEATPPSPVAIENTQADAAPKS